MMHFHWDLLPMSAANILRCVESVDLKYQTA